MACNWRSLFDFHSHNSVSVLQVALEAARLIALLCWRQHSRRPHSAKAGADRFAGVAPFSCRLIAPVRWSACVPTFPLTRAFLTRCCRWHGAAFFTARSDALPMHCAPYISSCAGCARPMPAGRRGETVTRFRRCGPPRCWPSEMPCSVPISAAWPQARGLCCCPKWSEAVPNAYSASALPLGPQLAAMQTSAWAAPWPLKEKRSRTRFSFACRPHCVSGAQHCAAHRSCDVDR